MIVSMMKRLSNMFSHSFTRCFKLTSNMFPHTVIKDSIVIRLSSTRLSKIFQSSFEYVLHTVFRRCLNRTSKMFSHVVQVNTDSNDFRICFHTSLKDVSRSLRICFHKPLTQIQSPFDYLLHTFHRCFNHYSPISYTPFTDGLDSFRISSTHL